MASRRSCRDFDAAPIPEDVLRRVLSAAGRAPSAGNTWGLDLVVVREPHRYWDVTLPAGPRRDAFGWPGLLRAPVLVVPVVDPDAYLRRYSEPDKASSGLGSGEDAWAVPYWWVDGGAAVMSMLLAATAEGLGSLLFGQFGHEGEVAELLGIPAGHVALGTVALGRPGASWRASGSALRGRPGLDGFLHDERW